MKSPMGLLLALSPKGKGSEKDDGDEAKKASAQAILDAITAGSASELSAALEQHYMACEGMGEGDDAS